MLRHNDIRTTLRYAHVSYKTKREKYETVFKSLNIFYAYIELRDLWMSSWKNKLLLPVHHP